jgi:hypothetical protein
MLNFQRLKLKILTKAFLKYNLIWKLELTKLLLYILILLKFIYFASMFFL